jgi:hypothetical protein
MYEPFSLQWPEPTCLGSLLLTRSASSHVMAQSTTQVSGDIPERENRRFVRERCGAYGHGAEYITSMVYRGTTDRPN